MDYEAIRRNWELPLPSGISLVAQQTGWLIRRVPPAEWTTYKDIAEVLGSTPRGISSAGLTLTQSHRGETIEHWTVPWLRVRKQDGSSRAPGIAVHGTAHMRQSDEMWNAEGGRWDAPGIYAAWQRFPLAEWVRREKAQGRWPWPV